jgi:hypothetical protein
MLCAVTAAGAGCAPLLRHPTYVPQPTDALQPVDQLPPPARVEVVPERPGELAVWVDGQWLWRRARWAWLSGRWVKPPPDAAYSPWFVVRGTDGQLWYAPGVWRDAHGTAIESPPALAVASVEAGAVVDADGTTETTGPILHDPPHALPTAPSTGSSPVEPSKGSVPQSNP